MFCRWMCFDNVCEFSSCDACDCDDECSVCYMNYDMRGPWQGKDLNWWEVRKRVDYTWKGFKN